MKTIIAATDFAPVSMNAVYYAADLAATLKAELLLMNVLELPVTVSEVPVSEYLYDEVLKNSEEELDKLRNRLLQYSNNKISIRIKTATEAVPVALRTMCEESDIFAVIIGTDDKTTLEHLIVPNNAAGVVRTLQYPVLIIPRNSFFNPYKNIALAVDVTKEYGFKTFEIFREWIEKWNGKLNVLYVPKHKDINVQAVPGTIALQKDLESFNPQFHFLERGNIEERIDEFIEQNQIDLLAVIHGKYGFFESIFHKSRSIRLINHPQTPVLVIPDLQ